MKLRLGTRRSVLARTQSGWVADLLRAHGHEVELVHVVTEGDVSTESLASLGGTGVFASALRQALRRGDVDLAVHSFKDLPTAPEAGLVIGAVPRREDSRDVLVTASGQGLHSLGAGAKVGTGSPRRRAQLAALGVVADQVRHRAADVEHAVGAVGHPTAGVTAAAGYREAGEQVTGAGRRPAKDVEIVSWRECATAAAVIDAVEKEHYDLLILDGEAAPTGGLGLTRQLKNEIEDCPKVLVLTGRPADGWLASWSQAEAAVPHPIDPIRLTDAVVGLLTRT